jgi:hypothetical protein
MSYDIAIWFNQKPVSANEALAHYKKLCDGDIDNGESSPKVKKFLSEMNQLYKDDDEKPWSDPDVSKHHVLLSLTYSSLSEVIPTAKQLAAKHGLICYDPQTTEVSNPGDWADSADSIVTIKDRAKQRRKLAKEFGTKLLTAIGETLVSSGFVKCSRDHFTYELDKGIRGVLVFSVRTSGAETYSKAEVWPYIGICSDEVNQIVAKLWPGPLDVYQRSLIAHGCLKKYSWHFFTPGDYDGESIAYMKGSHAYGYDGNLDVGIQDITNAINDRGFALFRNHANLKSICKSLALGKYTLGYAREQAVGLVMIGKHAEAKALLAKELERTNKTSPLYDDYVTFCQNFFAHFFPRERMA